jgi:signal transduction histidine kinase
MLAVVALVVAAALVYAQRNVAADVREQFQRQFRDEVASLHSAEAVRRAALFERCRALARKPRIHAALEDNALDLLYPSARDELADLLESKTETDGREGAGRILRAQYYRFMGTDGKLLTPEHPEQAGRLEAREESRLELARLPEAPQIGYVPRSERRASVLDEVIATPIYSSETGQPVAALLVGFPALLPVAGVADSGLQRGIWVGGELHLNGFPATIRHELEAALGSLVQATTERSSDATVMLGGAPFLLFYQRLNASSLFPPAFEVCVYSLDGLQSRRRTLTWKILGLGAAMMIVAAGASHMISARLSRPVENLAVNSERNLFQRRRAEAALELSQEELQRSARFSANASHQLKTPITVLRLGLEDLLAGEKVTPEAREELSGLVHQTFRLTSIIEDLLLLSRMDAGRLQLEFAPVDLSALVEGWLDDLSAIPDELGLSLQSVVPPGVMIWGEKRYTTLVLQNLLENARKYNRRGGRIHLSLRTDTPMVRLTVGNTGMTISPEAQPHIFQRFHRAAVGENVPGHGLGLNLARELARLHRGDLRLVTSDGDWTEFEVSFLLAESAKPGGNVV